MSKKKEKKRKSEAQDYTDIDPKLDQRLKEETKDEATSFVADDIEVDGNGSENKKGKSPWGEGGPEAEIAELDDLEEQALFLSEIGLEKPGVLYLIQATYRLLNLQTYFTASVKEVKAWTIEKGMKAPQAAGVIHSDFEKGFIRAEVIDYNNFVDLGSEQACKDAGKLSVEGKEYVVKDGDVMHFRFNV